MTPDVPISANRSGLSRWRGIIALLPLLAVLLFTGFHLILSGPWTRRWLSTKIQNTIHLPTRISGITWTPSGGIALHSLEIDQPAAFSKRIREPLISVAKIQLIPAWRPLLQGKIETQRIALDSPRLWIPVELLAYFLKDATPPPPPSVIAAAPAPTRPVAPVPQPSTQAPVAAAPAANKTPVVALPKIPSQPTTWIDLKNASLTLASGSSAGILTETLGVTGSIPVAGDPATSSLLIGSIAIAGASTATPTKVQLAWDFPIFSVAPFETQIGGTLCLFSVKLARLPGFPLQLEAQIPAQALRTISLPYACTFAAESIAANARFRGFILAPSSWDGELRTELKSADFTFGNTPTRFDYGSSITFLRGGILSCVDARLTGESISLLGNATLVADGRLAAVARLVSDPNTLNTVTSRLLTQAPGPRPLTELSTPQRAAFDLEVSGTIQQFLVRLGKDGPILNIKP